MSAAETMVLSKGGSVINPKELLGQDLTLLTQNISKLLGSGHPVLSTISNYYFSSEGKHVRPVLVLLISQATSIASKSSKASSLSDQAMDAAISKQPFSVEFEPTITTTAVNTTIPKSAHASNIPATSIALNTLPTQRRLAEITEMIHTASLLHDDVIDVAESRRSANSANAEFGNKMAILAGDFLLARASVALSRLRNLEVVEIMSTTIANLVEGEFMQLRNSPANLKSTERGEAAARFEYYLEKTYLKTASLIANSCRAAAVLGGCTKEIADAIVDDLLDFVVSAEELGKPSNADLKLGLATAPVLYASEEYPELLPLIERQFKSEGDVDKAFTLVHQSNGINQTRDLAASYCREAINDISVLPPSSARDALVHLAYAVLNRRK
ncbi:coq1 putative hexaprenyl diphosphate synthase [Chytridiales sp. JEL 0842]|nr:coq1 putative hexaprenyl diphosphate synthase [Chytridiales sp. JEL 0842]